MTKNAFVFFLSHAATTQRFFLFSHAFENYVESIQKLYSTAVLPSCFRLVLLDYFLHDTRLCAHAAYSLHYTCITRVLTGCW